MAPIAVAVPVAFAATANTEILGVWPWAVTDTIAPAVAGLAIMLANKPFAWALPAPFPAGAFAAMVEIAPFVDAVAVEFPAGDIGLAVRLKPKPRAFPDEFPDAPETVTV
jgi:hypothetical protein